MDDAEYGRDVSSAKCAKARRISKDTRLSDENKIQSANCDTALLGETLQNLEEQRTDGFIWGY